MPAPYPTLPKMVERVFILEGTNKMCLIYTDGTDDVVNVTLQLAELLTIFADAIKSSEE